MMFGLPGVWNFWTGNVILAELALHSKLGLSVAVTSLRPFRLALLTFSSTIAIEKAPVSGKVNFCPSKVKLKSSLLPETSGHAFSSAFASSLLKTSMLLYLNACIFPNIFLISIFDRPGVLEAVNLRKFSLLKRVSSEINRT